MIKRILLVAIFILVGVKVFSADYFRCTKCNKSFKIDQEKMEFQMKNNDKFISVNNTGVLLQMGHNQMYISNKNEVVVNFVSVDYFLDFERIQKDLLNEIFDEMQKCKPNLILEERGKHE